MSNFGDEHQDLRTKIFKFRVVLAIFICPIIGLFLLLMEIRDKGITGLTFRDVYPAISISLAGIVYLYLYRFMNRQDNQDLPPEDSGEQGTENKS